IWTKIPLRVLTASLSLAGTSLSSPSANASTLESSAQYCRLAKTDAKACTPYIPFFSLPICAPDFGLALTLNKTCSLKPSALTIVNVAVGMQGLSTRDTSEGSAVYRLRSPSCQRLAYEPPMLKPV